MLKKSLLGLAALLAVLVLVVALQPGTFHIERSTTIAAPPENAFALVNDFRSWRAWSPWEKLDPGMQRTYSGAPAGVGAKYAWVGNDEVGEGRMAIEQAEPPSKLVIRLEFLKPFAATNVTTFRFVNTAGQTTVTWSMDGDQNFAAKAFGLFMDMDALVGADFERGLANLKAAAEAARPSAAATP